MSLYFRGEGRKKVKFWLENWVFTFFFLSFGLACRKIEAPQRFWYQRVVANIVFRNWPRLICITIDVPVLENFPKILCRLSPEIRASLKKINFYGIFFESATNYVNFIFLRRTWKFGHFLPHFCDQVLSRTMAANKKIRV